MSNNKEKNPHAASLGRLGGKARKKKLTKEQRSEIARKAANMRWTKRRQNNSSEDHGH